MLSPMLSIAHVFVGAAVGVATGNPVAGLLAGVISHHILDAVPHWDAGSFYAPTFDPVEPNLRDYLIATADVLAAAALLWWLAVNYGGGLTPSLLAGGLGGLIPDVWHHIPLWKKRTRQMTARWMALHERWHRTVEQRQMPWGLLTQAVAIGLAWWYMSLR